MILDTSIVIDKVKDKEEIFDNITIITLIEYPPIKNYKKFYGKIYYISYEEQLLAVIIQEELRKKGTPMSVGDIFIAAVAINRDEVLLTKDKDFLLIQSVYPKLRLKVLD